MKQILNLIALILIMNIGVCEYVLAANTVKKFDPPQEDVLPDGTRALYNREEITPNGKRIRYYTEVIQWGSQPPIDPTKKVVQIVSSETIPGDWTSWNLKVKDFRNEDRIIYISSWPGAKVTLDDMLQRGLIKPKPRFIDWMKDCKDFDPATGEFMLGSWTDYEEITDNELLDTIARVATQLVTSDEEDEIVVNAPDNITIKKQLCALWHERSLTVDFLAVPTIDSTPGIQRIDPILSLPNLKHLGINDHPISPEEVKKVVVLPKLRMLGYDQCDYPPNRADYPAYPGPEIICKDGNN